MKRGHKVERFFSLGVSFIAIFILGIQELLGIKLFLLNILRNLYSGGNLDKEKKTSS